jgi:formamidopyrimidine-DNA glycosylase
MIEMPEATTIAKEMNETLVGKIFQHFSRGDLTHKFLWLTKPAEEYDALLSGKSITSARSYGRSIFLNVGETLVLLFADLGGRILYHSPGEPLPAKYHLRWDFSDASTMSFSMQMWGFVGLLDKAELASPKYADTGIPPLSAELDLERFNQLLDGYPEKNSKGIKGFLTTSKYIHGIGNGYLQDILFHAKIQPTRKIPTLSPAERHRLYSSIQETISDAIRLGGREDERDLFNQPGGYHRLMSADTAGSPCPSCGTAIKKFAYLGGACYVCPYCQV